MGHVEFEGRRRASLNVVYNPQLEDVDLVAFEVITGDGSLGVQLPGRIVEALHDSLGEWRRLRRERQRNKRLSKKRERSRHKDLRRSSPRKDSR